MPFINTVLTGGGMSLVDGLTGVWNFVTKGFELMTTEPMIYYVALGLLGTALGIFGRAKAAAH